MGKEAEQEQEPGIKKVNIDSVRFNSNHSGVLASQKTSTYKVTITVPYNIDMGSDGNIMPFYIYKKLFPSPTVDQLAATKDAKIKLKAYNCTTITQLGRCKVKKENNNKCNKCIFFVVLGSREALLGMPDIELLNILNIN